MVLLERKMRRRVGISDIEAVEFASKFVLFGARARERRRTLSRFNLCQNITQPATKTRCGEAAEAEGLGRPSMGCTASTRPRCDWVGDDPAYRAYHDDEWGVPSFDDRYLFEMICLEGAQAGLSWITILRKREGYRAVFANFEREAVADLSDEYLEGLREDARIVRHRQKIESVRSNAVAAMAVAEAYGSLAAFLWEVVDGRPRMNRWPSRAEVPARTDLSDRLSAELKRKGFKFVGSTICYAFMQAVGMVNDHTRVCFLHGVAR